MKENLTRIAIILDRSGSMQTVREATVSGFNEFIRQQKALPGEASVLLVQFDDQYEVVFDKPLAEVPELTQDGFVPRGWTALLDAQGRTIVKLGADLAAMPEADRPSKVVVMTLTDGMENASKEYDLQQIGEMIRHQRDVYNWEFVFLGANQDAIATAASMNIPVGAALTYAAVPMAMPAAMSAASSLLARARAGVAAVFTDEERKAAMGGGKSR
jgi:hypothetical protein